MIRGIIHVTGEHDTGKTTFALECGAKPSRIVFFDDDVKGRAQVGQLPNFGRYHDLVELGRDHTEVDYHWKVRELVYEIKPDEFDAIIWDTWTGFQKTFHPVVVADPTHFRKNWSPMGRIKGAEQWQEAERLEAQVLNHMQSLAQTVIIVTHLKDFYVGNQKVEGKQVPAGDKALTRVARLRLWLRHNEHSPVPYGLVLKRLGMPIETEHGIRTVAVLPRKITPREGEQSLWDSIMRYESDPVGLRALSEDEIPDAYELSLLDGVMTAEQSRMFELMLQAQVAEDKPPSSEELQQEARELGLQPPSLIARTLSERHGIEITVPQVVQWLRT